MSIHLSSLCSRKKLQYIFKLIVLVVFVNFVGYVVVSNFNILANNNNGQKLHSHQHHNQHGNVHNYEKLKFEEFMKKRKEEEENGQKQIKIDDILGEKILFYSRVFTLCFLFFYKEGKVFSDPNIFFIMKTRQFSSIFSCILHEKKTLTWEN